MEREVYTITCEKCNKFFESTDDTATLCHDCWQEIVGLDDEGIGDDSDEEEP